MSMDHDSGLDIAIIGVSGAFPGAVNLEEYFYNLKNGVESISSFSDSELAAAGIPSDLYQKENYIKAKGYLEKSECFDYSFFGYTPREARYMDPQTRLLHEHTWQALEDSGYPAGSYNEAIGMYVGGRPHLYWEVLSLTEGAYNGADNFEISHLNDKDLMSTRVSHRLNLKGPSFTLFTACSTSLVAVHLACQGVLSGECNIAAAGGISITTPSKSGYLYQDGMILAPDGHCRAFDLQAKGTVVGNGVGMVILKRLQDAQDDNDHIYAIIKGSAINNDGNRKVGYTAPSVEGQVEVIRAAQSVAGVEPESINYIEAHGTGTFLGDPIEVKALTTAFQSSFKNFCGLGSVKSNIGHLDSAAGIAGLIKTILALKHKLLFPTIHFNSPNTNIEFEDSPFYIVDHLREWKRGQKPRRAGISSFGVGGTNAHIVLEEAPYIEIFPQKEETPELLIWSAKTKQALDLLIKNTMKHIRKHPEDSLTNIAYTLQNGRNFFQHRCYMICPDRKKAYNQFSSDNKLYALYNLKQGPSPVYVILPDVKTETIRNHFQSIFNCFDEIELKEIELALIRVVGCDLNQIISGAHSIMNNNLICFYYYYILIKWLNRMGVKPAGILGSDSSEYVAACLAGVFSLEDALLLVKKRSQFLQELSNNESDPFLYEVIQSDFYQVFSQVKLLPANMILFSCTTGKELTHELVNPDYWVNNLNNSKQVSCQNFNIPESASYFVPTYMESFEQHIFKDSIQNFEKRLITFSKTTNMTSGWEIIKEIIGEFWLKGYDVKWDELDKKQKKRRIPIPTYPFQRKEFTVDGKQIKKIHDIFTNGQSEKQLRLPLKDWYYLPSWERFESNQQELSIRPTDTYLVFMISDDKIKFYCDQLEEKVQKVITVSYGKQFERINEKQFIVNPANETDYEKLFIYLSESNSIPQSILHFWSYTGEITEYDNYSFGLLESGYFSLLNIVRAIGTLNYNKNIAINIITNHLFDVIGTEKIQPEKATILGPVNVIPKEYPFITCRLMDITDCTADFGTSLRLLQEISTDLTNSDIVALRNQYTWQPVFKSVKSIGSVVPQFSRLKGGGVYIITGGLGGLGLIIARFLAEHYRAHLVLVSRSNFLPDTEWKRWSAIHGSDDPVSIKIVNLKSIRDMGIKMFIKTADMANEEQLQDVFSFTLKEFGQINGVIHTAGIPDGSVIQRRTKQMCEQVFASKITGTYNLQRIIETLPCKLDFFLLCSSLSSIISPAAQVAYCSANAFLDSFAKYNTQKGYFTQSIDWDMWQNVGMSSNHKQVKLNYSNLPGFNYQSLSHPLFEYFIQQYSDKIIFFSIFNNKKNWFLDEHRVQHKAVLPGTCYIEIARAAYQLYTGNKKCIGFREIFFLVPLILEDNIDIIIRTTFSQNKGEVSFLIESFGAEDSNKGTTHAKGFIFQEKKTAVSHNIEILAKECEELIFTQDNYNHLRDSQFTYGPHWNCYVQGKFKENKGLSFVKLPEEYIDELSTYQFHPALIDVALVFLDETIMGNRKYAPFSYQSIIIRDSVPKAAYSYIQFNPNSSNGEKMLDFNINIMDEIGNVIIDIQGYKMADVSDQKITSLFSRITEEKADSALNHIEEDGMSQAEGMILLSTALSTSYSQLIISTSELTQRYNEYKNEKLTENTVYGDKAKEDEKLSNVKQHTNEQLTQILIHIWQTILGYDKISIEDDFFELGGDSLKVLTIAEKIHSEINVKIPITAFFNASTIEKLLKYINSTFKTLPYPEITKATGQKYYQLSSAQARLYFQQQISKDNIAYNIPQFTLIDGELDVKRLEKAFEKLIIRHSMLRATFTLQNSELVQIIHDTIDFNIETEIVESKDLPDLISSFMQPFDLSKAPLFRIKVVCYGENKYVLLFDIHHIIADNISVMLLQKELLNFYNKIDIELVPLSLNYIDYVYWRKELTKQGFFERQKEYWLTQFSDSIPVLQLPVDYERPALASYAGDLFTFVLDKEETTTLKKMMKTQSTTMFMNMMTILSILLYKYSGQDDITVGTSVAGRYINKLADIVGMFANILPLRIKIDEIQSYTQFVKGVKNISLQAFENQDIQFEVLVDSLGAQRDLSTNPLFNVMLVVPDFKPAEIQMEKAILHDYPFRNKSSKFDLTLWVYDYEESIELRLEYATDLFHRDTIKIIADHFLYITRQVLNKPESIIKEISLTHQFVKQETDVDLDDVEDFVF